MYAYYLLTPKCIQQVQLNSHVARIFSFMLATANMDISSFYLWECYCLTIDEQQLVAVSTVVSAVVFTSRF